MKHKFYLPFKASAFMGCICGAILARGHSRVQMAEDATILPTMERLKSGNHKFSMMYMLGPGRWVWIQKESEYIIEFQERITSSLKFRKIFPPLKC